MTTSATTEPLPSIKVYLVSRLPAATKRFGPVAEHPIVADDDDDAISKLRQSYLLIEYGSGYEADDVLMIKAPDQSVILTKSIAELIK